MPRGAENEFNGAAASVEVIWNYSYIPNLKRNATPTFAVKELADEIKEYGSWRKLSYAKFFQQRKETSFPVSKRGNNGINPWLFLPNQKGNDTTIEAIHFKDETLHLDLKGPDGIHPNGESGVHTASVWIDVKTLKVTKIFKTATHETQTHPLPRARFERRCILRFRCPAECHSAIAGQFQFPRWFGQGLSIGQTNNSFASHPPAIRTGAGHAGGICGLMVWTRTNRSFWRWSPTKPRCR